MNQELPKFHEIFNPILNVLSNGEVMHTSMIKKKVIENYYSYLSPELLQKTLKSGDLVLDNRINWAMFYLKKTGYVHSPTRGNLQITEKGLAQKTHLSIEEVNKQMHLLDSNRVKNDDKNKSEEKIKDQSPQDLINEGFLQIDKNTKALLIERLKNIDPYYFEKVILILLKKIGYGDFIDNLNTKKSYDGGIDGIINEDKLGLDKIYIQAKRFTDAKVGERYIRDFIGAMSGDTNKGIFVTTSLFDKRAEEKAKSAHHKIILIDGNKLADLMHEYNVGVQVKEIKEIKTLDEDFFIEQ